MLSAICFNLDQSQILSSGNGLINQAMTTNNSTANHGLTKSILSDNCLNKEPQLFFNPLPDDKF